MKNLICILFFLSGLICFCQHNSQNDSVGLQNVLKSSKMKPDKDSIILFDKDTFNYFLKKDLSVLTESFENEYGLFGDQTTLDTALILLYGERYSSFRRKLTEEEYTLNKSIGCRMLLILVKRNHPDGTAYFGEALIRKKCPCESKYPGVQYLLKSAELNSLIGLHYLRSIYFDIGNYKKVVDILHFMADKLDDVGAMYELYLVYQSGQLHYGGIPNKEDFINTEKANYYLDKMIAKNSPEAMFLKADLLLGKSEKEKAFSFHIKAYEIYDSLSHTVDSTNYIERLYQLNFDQWYTELYGQKWLEYKKNRGK